jgi:hypothetical protein
MTTLQGTELRRYEHAARELRQVLAHGLGLGLGLGKASMTFDDLAQVIGNWTLAVIQQGEDAARHGVPDVMVRGVRAALDHARTHTPSTPCQCCGWAHHRAPRIDEEPPIVRGALDAQADAERRIYHASRRLASALRHLAAAGRRSRRTRVYRRRRPHHPSVRQVRGVIASGLLFLCTCATGDGACLACAAMACPSGEVNHWHADGCPSCNRTEGVVAQLEPASAPESGRPSTEEE